jgi:hypothetical protein
MSNRLYLTVYAPDDLPTQESHIASKSLGTVDACTELAYTVHEKGSGSFAAKIHRHHPQADLLRQDRYVIVHSDIGPVGGAFLEEAPIDLSAKDEQGGEWMTWSGRGQIVYLERGIMDMDSSLTLGHDPIDGFWDLSNQGDFAGASNGHPIPMFKRVLKEIQANTPNPLPLVDHSSWDYDLDSDGQTPPFWGEIVWGANIGDNAMHLAARMTELGDVVWHMSHLFKFDAYLEYGDDKTGSFGASTVRFEKGVNVAAAISRKIRGNVVRTHLIVGGADRTYVKVADPDWSPGDPIYEGFLSVPETPDEDALRAAGLAHIESRKRQTDAWELPQHDHGDAPADGIYEPGPPGSSGHYWVGDFVSVHTGTGAYDANNVGFPVAAITWQLKTGEEANGDYWVIPEVGSVFYWTAGPSWEALPGNQHIPTPSCECPVPGTPGVPGTDVGLIDWDWQDTGNQEFTTEYTALGQPVQMVQGTNHSGLYGSEYGARMYIVGDNYGLPRVDVSGKAALIPVTPGASYRIVWRSLRASSGTSALGVDWFNGSYPFGSSESDMSQTVSSAIIKTWTQAGSWFGSTPNYMSHSEVITAPSGVTAMRLNSGGHPWTIADISVSGVGTSTPGTPSSGGTHPDLVGTEEIDGNTYFSFFDHEHLVIRDRPPDSNDDLAAGYDREKLWYNTTSGVLWVSVDDTNGAAVWQAVETIPEGTGDSAPLVSLSDTTPTTVVNANYSAFPAIAMLDPYHVVMVYRRGSNHAPALDGNIHYRIGTIHATTEAVSWGSEQTLWNHASLDLRDPTVMTASDGKLYATVSTGNGNLISSQFFGYVIEGTWNGSSLSWGTPVQMGTTLGSGGNIRELPQRLVELSDGSFGCPVSGKLAADSKDRVLWVVTDDPLDWSGATEVVIAQDSGEFFTEGVVVRFADGELLCLIRENDDKEIWWSRSYDEGATWSTPTFLFDGWGKPMMRQLHSGALALLYRQDSTGRHPILRISYDRGVTWTDELQVASGDMQYGDVLSINARTGLLTWSIENSSTDADIFATSLIDVDDVRYVLGSGSTTTTEGGGAHDHDADYADIAHDHGSASVPFFTVDPGTPTYDDTTDPDVVEVSVTAKWGIGVGGPYFNSAGVTSGEEAALMRDSETGAYFLRPYSF